jgi:hypothetical protein
VYLQYPTSYPQFILPIRSLRQFTRVHVPAGFTTTVTLTLAADAFTVVDNNGLRQVLGGQVQISVGGQQPGQSGPGKSCGQAPLTTTVTVTGGVTPYDSTCTM